MRGRGIRRFRGGEQNGNGRLRDGRQNENRRGR